MAIPELRSRPIERRREEMSITLRYPEFHEIGNLWSINNFLCLFLLGALKVAEWHGLSEPFHFWLCFGACLTNSVADFLLTGRKVYMLQAKNALGI